MYEICVNLTCINITSVNSEHYAGPKEVELRQVSL